MTPGSIHHHCRETSQISSTVNNFTLNHQMIQLRLFLKVNFADFSILNSLSSIQNLKSLMLRWFWPSAVTKVYIVGSETTSKKGLILWVTTTVFCQMALQPACIIHHWYYSECSQHFLHPLWACWSLCVRLWWSKTESMCIPHKDAHCLTFFAFTNVAQPRKGHPYSQAWTHHTVNHVKFFLCV